MLIRITSKLIGIENTFDIIIDIPVTPPSKILLGIRKVSRE